MEPLNVGIVGLGTVGGAAARILLESADHVARRAGRPVHLRRAVVRDLSKPRAVELPEGVLGTDPAAAVDDPEIDLVVQLIGGTDTARELMLASLAAGKDVVTANKALLAEHGRELFDRARELGRCIAFEAAVAGGIPVIRAVGEAMTANRLTGIEAILNGTSNFILTKMLAERRGYEDVLAEAQRLGYAEADPAMDVDGTDAAQKLILLTELAMGTRVPLDAFPRQGIDHLLLDDLLLAHELGYVVKLLAVTKLANGQLEMHVQPTLVRIDRPLAQCDDAYNMIALDGDAVGRTWYAGAGAGGMATASAVVADVVDVAAGRAKPTFDRLDLWGDIPPLPVQPAEEIERRFYLRFTVEDRPHVFADIADILGRQGISLASIIQHESPEETDDDGPPTVPLVVMTHRTTEGQLRKADEELQNLSSVKPPTVRMPVAD